MVRTCVPHDMSAAADSCLSWIRQPRKATTPQTTFSSKCQSNAGPWIGGLPSWPQRIIGGEKKVAQTRRSACQSLLASDPRMR